MGTRAKILPSCENEFSLYVLYICSEQNGTMDKMQNEELSLKLRKLSSANMPAPEMRSLDRAWRFLCNIYVYYLGI